MIHEIKCGGLGDRGLRQAREVPVEQSQKRLPHESGAPQKTRLRLLSHQTPPNSPSQLEADYIRRRELSAERLRKFGRGLLATRTQIATRVSSNSNTITTTQDLIFGSDHKGRMNIKLFISLI